jgi:hypothetical protein
MTTNETARHTDVAYSTPVANAIGGAAKALPRRARDVDASPNDSWLPFE